MYDRESIVNNLWSKIITRRKMMTGGWTSTWCCLEPRDWTISCCCVRLTSSSSRRVHRRRCVNNWQSLRSERKPAERKRWRLQWSLDLLVFFVQSEQNLTWVVVSYAFNTEQSLSSLTEDNSAYAHRTWVSYSICAFSNVRTNYRVHHIEYKLSIWLAWVRSNGLSCGSLNIVWRWQHHWLSK